MKNFIEYVYVIFEDEDKNVCVVRDCLVKNCVFGGMVGKITEVKRGVFTLDEYKKANCSFIGALINKKREYLSTR
ncbi:hypothetical protein CF086_17070 [Clostridium botulinum]|uniref:hypothetical protein n=1 Tax=Clostridium botulinum TaxID=1491 RepID=UPI0007736EF1|nr:hypothetical protein [Clostridium botulinum]MBN3352008.1 hypothetical protein [Clostridium botulinum]